jgi:hypothetical protein
LSGFVRMSENLYEFVDNTVRQWGGGLGGRDCQISDMNWFRFKL